MSIITIHNLQANIEYFRKNYKKSLKLLVSCKPKDLYDSFATFYNNVGCVYFKLTKWNAAILYFQRSIRSKVFSNKSQILHHSYAVDTAYNIGLSLLTANCPSQALDYFSICTEYFAGRPHLWIRMAECYIRCSNSLHDNDNFFEMVSTSSIKSRRVVMLSG